MPGEIDGFGNFDPHENILIWCIFFLKCDVGYHEVLPSQIAQRNVIVMLR